MHLSRKNRFISAIIPILLILAATGQAVVRAVPLAFWTSPQWIPGLMDVSPTQVPIFITDSTGTVHVVHTQWVGERSSIMYSKWAVGVGWSQPVDILMTTTSQARVIGAALDNTNLFSIVFWGGEEVNADIFLIQAPIQSAGKATAWSEPRMIGTNAIAPTTGEMITTGDGQSLVVYSGNLSGNGLYSIVSDDNGTTWSDPQAFFVTGGDLLWPSGVRISQASDGKVHAVWAMADSTGNSLAVYHSAYAPETDEWTTPHVLANAAEYEADTPNIIEHDGSLMVIYHNGFPTTRWMARSLDGGKTWTPPTRLFEQVGSNGAAALVIDSSNTLHMFFGNRVGAPSVHGLWHSVWQGDSWSVPDAVVSGPQVVVRDSGSEGFDPSYAQALIIQGNLALVVWRHDPMAGPTHIWYSYSYLDAPLLPTAEQVLLPSPTAVSGAVVRATPSVPTLAPTFAGEIPVSTGGNELSNTMVIGIGPALILIIAIIMLKRKKN